jgi:hypothetical protein
MSALYKNNLDFSRKLCNCLTDILINIVKAMDLSDATEVLGVKYAAVLKFPYFI